MKHNYFRLGILLITIVCINIGQSYADTWTVAGSSADMINGSSTWSPTTTSNDMTNVTGTWWGLLITGKSLSNSTNYQFKVCKNHGWGTSYPADNSNMYITTGGTYNIIYTYNSSGNAVLAVPYQKWTVAGSTAVFGSDWSTTAAANAMTKTGDWEYTLTKSNVSLSTGTTYEFKIVANNEWDNWAYSYPASNKTFTVGATGVYDVRIVFNIVTKTITVTTTRKYSITPSAKYTTNGTTYTAGTTGGTLTINGSSSATYVASGSTYTILATPNPGYCLETLDVGETNIYSQPDNSTRQTIAFSNSTSTATAAATVTAKFARIKDITVHIYVGGRSAAEINSVEMNGCQPYVGGTVLTALKVNNPSAGAPKFTQAGNWLTYTFSNVTKVGNITCARAGGNIFTGVITDDVYYNYDGTLLDGSCVSFTPTWNTTPANGAIGGSMTASVNTSAVSGGSPTVSWTSSNTTVATVNSSTGAISYRATGNTNITARVTWSATGDYCAGSEDLVQNITVTSGATVSATLTTPSYVATGVAGQVSFNISSTGAASGWYYRIYRPAQNAYEGPDMVSAASNSASWTMAGGVGTGSFTYVVQLYNSSNVLQATSANIVVTGEIAHPITIAAEAGGTVSPTGTIYANNAHVSPTITATPNTGYKFNGWTRSNSNVTFANAANASTTITATGASTATANFTRITTAITLNKNGGASNSSVTGTYGNTLPSFTAVSRAGYTLTGYWTAESGGTKIINANGTLVPSITNYTNGSSQWIHTNATLTLYAQWTESLTTVTINVSPAGAGTLTLDAADFTAGSTTTAGTVTSRTVVATANSDYIFSSWSTTGNATGTPSTNTYTLRGNGSGATGTLTANFTPKTKVRLYYSNPNGWATVYAYLWNSANASDKNAAWHGQNITTNTYNYNCNTYYYYEYYKEDHPNWNRVIFNDNGSNQSADITFSNTTNNGQYYVGSSWVASPDPKWVLAGSMNAWSLTSLPLTCESATSGYVDVDLAANTDYSFKFINKESTTWYGAGTVTKIIYTNRATAQDMSTSPGNNQTLKTAGAGTYRFTFNFSTKAVTVTFPTSYIVKYSANTLSGSNGHSAVPTATVSGSAFTSGNYVATGTSVTFSAKAAKSGYTFNGWYNATSGGTQLSASATYTATISATTTIYARYTQNTHTVTLTNANVSQGTVNTASPVTVGEAEAVQIRATNSYGYKFAGWVKTAGSGTVTYWTAAGTAGSSDATGSTKATTYIKTTGDVTLQATWEPDYTTGWYLAGTFNNGGGSDPGWGAEKVEFIKRDGESTGRVAYITMNLTNSTFASNGYHMELKVMTGSTWYGNSGIYTHDANDGTAWTMTSGAIGMNLTVSLTGTYTFKLDYSGANPKLSIYYPIINQLQVYDAYPAHAAAVQNWEWDSHVGTVYTKTLTLNSNTKYKFKPVYNSVFYGFKTGSPLSGDNNGVNPMTAYNCTDWRTYNDGGDCFIETTLAGDYVFTFNTGSASTPLSVEYPRNIILSCDANSWAQSTTNMTLLSGTTYYYDIALPADNLQEFKVVYNSKWYGGLVSEQTLTSTDCTDKALTAGASCYNMRLATTMAGTYRFLFNTATGNISVVYPTPPVTAMTGSLTLAATGIVKGSGTSADPWVVFAGNTMTVSATHTSKPATATDHIFYQFTDNAVVKPQQTTLTYNPSTASTTDKLTINARSYYEYGPAGYKTQGTPITSSTYYYQVVERPTVTLEAPVEVLKGSSMDVTYTPENTSIAGISAPTYQLYYKKWDGSAWGAETAAYSPAATTNPYSLATTPAKYTVGFYQWYVKMTYGGTTVTSNTVQNVIYQNYQVTVVCSGYAITDNKAWFKGLYTWRSPDGFSPNTSNADYPGQAREDCTMEVDDYTYVYSFKYPIYTHIQLNDNSSSTVNRTESIEITDNTCIEITGERFRGFDNWAFTKTAPCATTYYRVRSVFGDKTYYSNAVTSTSDIVSFFAGQSSDPDNKLYKETLTNGTWVSTLITPTVSASDVYYAPFKSVQTAVTLYTGSFYVRTDGSTGTWADYMDGGKTMYKFENNTAYPNEYYNHYWCAYLEPGTNVQATVANDYNRNLAITLPDVALVKQTDSDVNWGTNVRFAYNNTDNLFEITYLQAANIETFLQIYGLGDGGDISKNYCYKEESLTNKLTSSYKLNMSDLSDWMYQADFYVNAPGNDETYVDIIANYKKDGVINSIIHLGGLDEDDQVVPFLIMGSTTTASVYLIRVIYDYKTNRVVAAWLPYGSDLPDGILDANMMIIRTDDNEAKTVGVPATNKSLTNIHRVYGILEITKADYFGEDCDDCDADDGHLGKPNRKETGDKFYWICLPFDVKVKDVFGIDGFKEKWAIQRYRGDLRAKNGYHEGQTYWRNMNANETATMEAGRGYVIWVNLESSDFKKVTYIDENGVTRTRSQKRLFFPSDNLSDFTLTYDGSTISTVLPPNECEIKDRRNEDSNWYVAGIKGYNDSEVNSPSSLGSDAGTETGMPAYTPPYYFYEWSWDKDGNHQSDNYTARSVSGYTFKPFYSYMFQYAGTITWEPTDIKTIKSAPSRQGILAKQQNSETLLTITLEDEERQLDQTFITLSDRSDITEDFDLNSDLTKIINPRSQLFSYAGNTMVAGNTTPSTTESIPLGLKITQTADYTFHLEDVQNGQMVYLYDRQDGTRTCLNYNDHYAVLEPGNYNERFYIELAKMPNIATDIDSDQGSTLNVAVHNGSLYVEGIENGMIINLYNMTGRQIISTRYNIGEGIPAPPAGIYLLTTNHSTNKIIIQ